MWYLWTDKRLINFSSHSITSNNLGSKANVEPRNNSDNVDDGGTGDGGDGGGDVDEGTLRLVNGEDSTEGRLEVGAWDRPVRD